MHVTGADGRQQQRLLNGSNTSWDGRFDMALSPGTDNLVGSPFRLESNTLTPDPHEERKSIQRLEIVEGKDMGIDTCSLKNLTEQE
jgi:hypothetical protein